jgi:uncharacterized hydrophobic protein (TIGR00341 family)
MGSDHAIAGPGDLIISPDDPGSVRLVEVTIPAGKRDTVLEVLNEEGIDFVLTEETSNRDITAVVSFPLPRRAVEPVLDSLRDAGLPADAYTVVLETETVVSRRFEELSERYAEEDDTDDRIARDELQARAATLAPDIRTFAAMSVVSVVVATAGVLLDSAAVVVGSMVIAPLIGPAMATSTGTVLQDSDLFRRGVKFQVFGFVLAILTAAAFAWLLRSAQLVPLTNPEVLAIGQVRERLAPDVLSLAVALGAGVAGAYSLSSGVSTSLVGVAIAVALVPPTAVIGIGLAWGLPAVVAGAAVLVLVNVLSINLAALAVLWYQGYRPEHWFREDAARSATIKRVAVLGVAILLLSTFLGAVTYTTFQTAQLENDIRGDVRETLDRPAYAELSLVSVRVETREGTLFESPETVVIIVSHPPGETYPGLADSIARRMDSGQLPVEVQYVEIQRTG